MFSTTSRYRRLHDRLRRCALSLAAVMAIHPSPTIAFQTDATFGGVPSFSAAPGGEARYVRLAARDGRTRVTADFRGLQGDALSVSFDVDAGASRASMRGFGIAAAEIDSLSDTCRATAGCTQADLDAALVRYYRDHHLRVVQAAGQRPRLFVDIPEVVRRNRDAVRPVAAALRTLGSNRGFDGERILEAAVALVQGGLAYRTPASSEDGRQTLGFYTPPRALEQGFGDCDTKSALLAAILTDLGESRMIGVRVPGHYLLGLSREPRPGEAFVEYAGRPYVLVEAAGPASRRPGDVSDRTREALASREPLRIDPI